MVVLLTTNDWRRWNDRVKNWLNILNGIKAFNHWNGCDNRSHDDDIQINLKTYRTNEPNLFMRITRRSTVSGYMIRVNFSILYTLPPSTFFFFFLLFIHFMLSIHVTCATDKNLCSLIVVIGDHVYINFACGAFDDINISFTWITNIIPANN